MRHCPDCGSEMAFVKKSIKSSYRRRAVLRYKCSGCGLEESTSLKEHEENERELRLRKEEYCTREVNTY